MKVLTQFPLSNFTTFHIGGIARYFFQPKSLHECFEALKFIQDKQLPYFILGAGSNVLIGSDYYDGAVISTLALNKISLNDGVISAGAGVLNSDLALFALENGLGNFEFLYAMPGSLGGSTVMNARAFGSSMSDVVLAVDVIDDNFQPYRLYNDKLDYAYKSSVFHYKRYFIHQIFFKTKKSSKENIRYQMELNKKKRLATKQYDFPSAGCIFKNNYNIGISSGQIIDSLGLKGKRIGNVAVYKHHANFIINHGMATSQDVVQLIQLIQEQVKQVYPFSLECEIQFLGSLN